MGWGGVGRGGEGRKGLSDCTELQETKYQFGTVKHSSVLMAEW